MSDISFKTDELSILKDPFLPDKVKKVWIMASTKLFELGWDYRADVEFKNGNTEGKQSFKGESIPDLLNQIERFMKTL